MKASKRLKVSLWSIKTAWQLSKSKFAIWGGLSILLAILPSVSIIYYKKIVLNISQYMSDGSASYDDVIQNIIILGVVLSFIGLSNRINGDFLYMLMYDSYYLGIQSIMMDTIQQIDIEILRRKEIKDEYNAIIIRAGALTDFISSLCMLVSRLVGTIMLLIVAYTNSLLIFAIAIAYIVFVCIMNYKTAERNRGKIKRIREAERTAKQFEDIPSNLSVAKELRIFSSKSKIIDSWEEAYNVVETQKKEQNFQKEKDGYLLGIGFYVFNISALLYSIYMVCTYRMTPGIFLVIYALCQNMASAIADITKNFLNADYGLYSLERQKDFITNVQHMTVEDAYASNENSSRTDKMIIKTEHLSYGYTNDNLVLKDINLDIKKGETVALVGYNGSGKTTLTKLLMKLYKPLKGDIFLEGHSYNTIGEDYINSKIGTFFQNYSLFHATLKENVGFGDINYINQEKLIYEALHRGGADDIAASLPEGIDSWLFKAVKRDGHELSGGQKQRVAVSRTYMNNKDILIFDEPAAALDPLAEMQQFKKIKERLQGKTAILISHRIGFARMADRIIVLDNGNIVEEGTHNELMEKKELYYSFYNQQAEWYETDGLDMENEL